MANLIYLFPFLADLIVGQILFVNTVRPAQMGCSDSVITAIPALWGLVHVTGCYIVGRCLTPRNATSLALSGCFVLALASFLMTLFPSVLAMALLTALCGTGTSLFFPAFQIFMKAADAQRQRSVAHSTGMYTFAWSLGIAVGPLIAGFLMGRSPQGWIHSCYIGTAVALACAIGMAFFAHNFKKNGSTTATQPQAQGLDKRFVNAPDLAWLGWITTGLGCMILALTRAIFPALAEKELGMSEELQGFIIFLICLTQATTGLLLCRATVLMYRARTVLSFGLIGVIGVAAFAMRGAPWLFCVGAVSLGAYSGFFFFYLVFHSLTHPSRTAKYISVNEMVVGGTSVLGPLLAGLLAESTRSYSIPLVTGAIIIACAVTFQAIVHRMRPLARSS